jgi:L-phenylalanine/L-methionine N-acetyltransferase
MTDVTIRRAHPGDAEGFATMMGEPGVYSQLMQMPYADVEQWRERLSHAAASGQPDLQLVAEAEGRLVGSAGLHSVGPSLRRRHAMMLGISVVGAWQGRGVGRALMQALCDYADRWLGLRRLELQVYADNARAIALYRRFGFELEGTHRAYALRDGVLVDSLSMARLRPAPPLPQGPTP